MKLHIWMILALLSITTFVFATEPETVTVGGLKFSVPKGWKITEPTSSMRAAQIEANTGNSEKIEIVFFHFGAGEGGTKEENIARWMNQFQSENRKNEKIETVHTKGYEITLVHAQGTFNQGMPGKPLTPMPNYALLGAIIEQPTGAVFVKMAGPIAAVEKLEKPFRSMVTFEPIM